MSKKTKSTPTAPRSLISTRTIRPEDIGLNPGGADIVFEHHDMDLLRIDDPSYDELVPIDHRTVFGALGGSPLGLGYAYLRIIHEHFGDPVYLKTIRNWLRKRGISPDGMNWIDLIDLLRNEEPERPDDLATMTVVMDHYVVSRSTLKRAIQERKLTTYRRDGRGPHLLSLAAVGNIYPRR